MIEQDNAMQPTVSKITSDKTIKFIHAPTESARSSSFCKNKRSNNIYLIFKFVQIKFPQILKFTFFLLYRLLELC